MKSTPRQVNRRSRVVLCSALFVGVALLAVGCSPVTVGSAAAASVNTYRQAHNKSVLVADPANATSAALITLAQTWADKQATANPGTCKVSYPKPMTGLPAGYKYAGMSVGCMPDQGGAQKTADATLALLMTNSDQYIMFTDSRFTHLGTAATKTPSGLWYIVYYFAQM